MDYSEKKDVGSSFYGMEAGTYTRPLFGSTEALSVG